MTIYLMECICVFVGLLIGTIIGGTVGTTVQYTKYLKDNSLGCIFIGEQNGEPITWLSTDFSIDEVSKKNVGVVAIKDVREKK